MITEWASHWLEEERPAERPFFLYLHTVEPHAPYSPEEAQRARFAPDAPRGAFGTRRHIRYLKADDARLTDEVVSWLVDLYDAEIAANDAAFGGLLDEFERHGLLDETVVVFVSDHGEEFMEHGQLEHAKTFYREVIEVPLVMRFPDLGRGRRIAAAVQHVDVMPTILSYLGLAQPPNLPGRDLTAWLAAGAETPQRRPGAEIHSYVDRRGFRGASVRYSDWRYVEMSSPDPSEELYEIAEDPAERVDLVELETVRAGWLASRIRALRHEAAGGHLTPSVEELDDELRERLEALGYL